ncbi:MAG: hydroxymethylbilane synthase [Methanoregulaceae archaeon]|nr:hydroxymethylbilane synthase [Methanoregulaceae archaeon]
MPLLIGTRGSRLALAQAERVCAMLAKSGIDTQRVIVATQGDADTSAPLHEIGGQGLFVRALDDAILAGSIDAAVHSMKDIPAERPRGLLTSAVLTRDSPGDFLACRPETVEPGIVGTSSTRRRAQQLRYHPDREVRPLRGNVDTRLRKLASGEYDAIVLAEAGIERLGLQVDGARLPPETYVPAPNQGTIAVVSRDEQLVAEATGLLDDPVSRTDTMIERAVMIELGGGCFTPIGIFCRDGHLIAEVLSLDGTRSVRIEQDIDNIDQAAGIGRALRGEASGLIKEARERLGMTVTGGRIAE